MPHRINKARWRNAHRGEEFTLNNVGEQFTKQFEDLQNDLNNIGQGIAGGIDTIMNTIGSGIEKGYEGINTAKRWVNENIKFPIMDTVGIDRNKTLGKILGINSIGDIGGLIRGVENPLDPIPDQKMPDENPTSNENEMSEQDNAGNADTPTKNSEPTPTNAELERQQMLEDQQKLWEREDAIRKETQEREDTAYQRAVADMEKAGINPNLTGIQPASAGGGISNASGLNYNTMAQAMQNYTQMLLNEINNDVKIDENQKDRITNLINGVGKIFLLKSIIK